MTNSRSQTIKIDSITYSVEFTGKSGVNGPTYTFTKIGKRGKPIKQFRFGVKRANGTWNLTKMIAG